jgi:Flp pilus assembly protein CpaB
MAAIAQSQPRPVPAQGMRTPMFIFGVALALLAFLIMFAFGIVYVGRSQTGATVHVIVAGRDIDAREPITPDMISIGSFPANAVAANRTFAHVTDLVGYAAVVSIYKGEAITDNLVTNSDQISASQSAYLPIPKGYVAMTIPTSEQQGVAGYIAKGDYIEVIATVNTALFLSPKPSSVDRTVFTNLYVLRVGPQTAVPGQSQAQGVSSSITVVITQCDAEYLDWLLQNATLKYTLESYHDYQTVPGCSNDSAPALIGPTQVDTRWAFTKGT